ncbi:MAG: type I-B CRISPR-associated protein Cas5 [Nitrososphaerota archaeon]|nr:type I-B CRISPR-associated protein Cas5 [Nitrososphaerota archaeon]MDG6978773.1 type I-B CRISPR-associated protein Cas5 [Nitrososphaerota archaeon]
MARRVVVFDVWSNYAYFRRPYSTTAALTFNFIPRSAIEGLVGAILGIRSDRAYEALSSAKLALGIRNPVRKIPFATSHIHSDFWSVMKAYLENKEHKRNFTSLVSLELLVEPRYRIYVDDSTIEQTLVDSLSHHRISYTPYLGTSTMIANFAYAGYFEYVEQKRDADVESVVPFAERLPDLGVFPGVQYSIEEDIPARVDAGRNLKSSYAAVYNPLGGKIRLRNSTVNTFTDRDGEHHVVFIPA